MTANDAVKEALKGEDVDRIKSTTQELMEAFQRIGQAMYSQQQAAGGEQEASAAASAGEPSGEEAASSGDGDVVEGEIVDEGGAS